MSVQHGSGKFDGHTTPYGLDAFNVDAIDLKFLTDRLGKFFRHRDGLGEILVARPKQGAGDERIPRCCHEFASDPDVISFSFTSL